MNRKPILNPYFFNEEIMTTEQYIQKKQQEALDKEFDEMFEKISKIKAEEQAKQEHKQEFNNLVTQLADVEAELDIAENMYRQNVFNIDVTTKERVELNKLIATLKTKYTKLKRKIDVFVKAEQV